MKRYLLAACLAATIPSAVQATENGGSSYPQGPEGYLTGALPPPGTYFINYLEHYSANRFNDGSGKKMIPDFHVRATAEVARFVHVTGVKILGADWAFQTLIPLVHLNVGAAGSSQTRNGLGDITITPAALGWHFNNFHAVVGIDFNLPTGRYNQNDLANIGRNYLNIEPVIALTYHDPKGLELSAKLMYDFNLKNGKGNINGFNPTGAGYRSGQEFHTDFSAGWNFGNFEAGVHGYWYVQTTKDKVDDPIANAVISQNFDGLRGKAFAIGPTARYAWGSTQFFASWQKEVYTRYRPEGDKFWLKFAMPL